MSGFTEDTCPNCGELADIYTENCCTTVTCFNCGLTVAPKISYLTLEQLNKYRVDADLEPLETLPEQNQIF